MVRHIISKELKDCVYGYRSVVVFVLAVSLFAISTATGAHEYTTRLQEYRRAEAQVREQVRAAQSFYDFASNSLNFSKPPLVLGVLVSGADYFAPQVYAFNLYDPPRPQSSPTAESPDGAVFGSLDLAFIVEVVLGLAALLFTFSMVCGEKETGTLKLQLANALPRDTLLLGKLLGNLLGLLIPVTLAFLIDCLLLATLPGIALSGTDVLRIALLGVNFVLYLVVLFALGAWVSTLTTRSTTSFALCLMAWVLLVAILPKLSLVAARQLSPLGSLADYEMKKVQIGREGTIKFQEALRQYSATHNGQSPPRLVYEELVAPVRTWQNQEFNRLAQDYEQRRQRLARTALLLSRLTPAGSASFAAMCLVGTSLDRDFRFRAALDEYRDEVTSYYDNKRRTVDPGPEEGTVSFTDLPSFEFREEPLSAALDRALPDFGLLAAWSLVLFVAAYFRFARYDVR